MAEPARSPAEGAWKPGMGHNRGSSLQIPRRGSISPHNGSTSGQSTAHTSPRVDGPSTPIIADQSAGNSPHTRQGRTLSSKNVTSAGPPTPRKGSGGIPQTFKFPSLDSEEGSVEPDSALSPKSTSFPPRNPSPRPQEADLSPITRIISEHSINGGTPRSSVDFDLMSNHSGETIVSEYAPQPSARLIQRPNHTRNSSRLGIKERPKGPETLMMGYAQVVGSFTLDGSLVNQAPFEEVKRKGVVGGHGGGGVVGVERTKRESGLFGAFGWNNIGESLGGLLGGSELSSIKEMRGMASSKTIPLVSTPHSILFVDLRLEPGESKSYTYRFTLPRGLPPSHKGRAIKVSYHLVVGTQRAGTGQEQQVRSVDVPFRVFGSVNPRGDSLGHDLMSPYILLRDMAKTGLVSSPGERPKKPPDSGTADFKSYIETLLSTSQNTGLLSPTSPLSPVGLLNRRHSSMTEEPRTMKEAIDFAILRSNHLTGASPGQAPHQNLSNKFDIARSGRRVATLLLPRPAYRLGETINLIVSFQDIDIPTYALQVVLETSEKVDPAIAMRSPSSIYRYTRKVHAYHAETALFAKRLSFALSVPATATPDFETSGVSLEWRVRIEFVTPRVTLEQVDEEEGLDMDLGIDDLMEEVGRDDRGVVLQGVERLNVETFEVSLPVRVYGEDVAGSGGDWDADNLVV